MTFTGFAIEEAEALVTKATGLLTEIRDAKGQVRDVAALQILVNLQSSLLGFRQQAGDLRKHLEAAKRNNEHTHITTDFKSRAAGETDEDAEQELPFR